MNVVSDPVVRTVAPQLLCRRCAEVGLVRLVKMVNGIACEFAGPLDGANCP